MTNRKIRDTVFCHFMSNESHLLSLCNALNDTGYDESSDITINTLEGSFFSNIKNDISFLLNNLMVVLIEHQTTINPNMLYCLENNVMVDYLKNNKKEVIDMFGFEWNEKEEREALLEIGEERGEARGRLEGKLEGKIESIKELMRNLNWSPEKAMTALGIAPSEFSRYLTML